MRGGKIHCLRKKKAYEDLYEGILSFENANGFTAEIETRSPFWRRFGRVVAIDATALVLGNSFVPGLGTLCSIFASITGIVIVSNDNSEMVGPICFDLIDTQDFQQMAPSLDLAGYEHNTVISTLFEEESIESISNDYVGMVNSIISIYKRNHPDLSISSYEDFKLAFPLIDSMINCDTEDALLELCFSEISSEEEEAIARQLLNTISSISETSDLAFYSESVQDIIEQSSIPDQDKQQLNQMVSVGSYSQVFWNYEME